MCLNETYIKVPTGKHLSYNIPVQNGLKQGNALPPLLLNLSLKYAIRMVQENQMGRKLDETHQLTVYENDVNLLVNNFHVIRKSYKL
jgi:hypothetical protein